MKLPVSNLKNKVTPFKNTLLIGFLLFYGIQVAAQDTLKVVESKVSFDGGKNIEAINTTSTFSLKKTDNTLQSSITIKDFVFPNSLMQEHFNEKYIESDKFPKASFNGVLEEFDVDKITGNPKKFNAKGVLTIHGVAREVKFPVVVSKTANSYKITSNFVVKLEDHDIKIPKLMFVKVTEQATVTTEAILE